MLNCVDFPSKLALLHSALIILFRSSDHYDVKMPCHLILSKLADKCPSAVLAGNFSFSFRMQLNLIFGNMLFLIKLEPVLT